MEKSLNNAVQQARKKVRRALNPVPLLLLLVLLPLLLLLLTLALVWLLNQRPSVAAGELTRTLERPLPVYFYGESIPVVLKPSAVPDIADDAPQQAPVNPADIIITLDTSGSMGSAHLSGNPLYEALAVIGQLSGILREADVSLAFARFDTNTLIPHPLGSSVDKIINGLSTITATGGTDIAQAIGESLKHLTSAPRPTARQDQSAGLPTGGTERKRLMIIITDGHADVNSARNLARQASDQGVSIIGIAIGPQAMNFFSRVLTDAPGSERYFGRDGRAAHHFIAWRGGHLPVFESLQDLLVSDAARVLRASGQNLLLEEYPHFNALPHAAAVELPGHMTALQKVEQTLVFKSQYLLATPQSFAYALRADTLGVHPVARAQAAMSFRPFGSPEPVEQFSGNSPRILVITPLLLLLLWLPALLWALYSLLRKREPVNLLSPHTLPGPPTAPVGRDLPRHDFLYRSGQLASAGKPVEQIPTLVLALGPQSAARLQALNHHQRRQRVLDWGADHAYYPLYLDCRPMDDGAYGLAPKDCLNLADNPTATPLAELLHELGKDGKPWLHPQADWFDGLKNRATPTIEEGCHGDRKLARLLLYRDLLSDTPQLEALSEKVRIWFKRFPRGQLILMADGGDDLGSGWSVDIAWHLRRGLGGRTTPFYLVLALPSVEPLQRQNYQAFVAELNVLQKAAPHTFVGLVPNASAREQADRIRLDYQPLPLFDRVIQLRHDGNPASPALSAAMVAELMDARVKAHLNDNLRPDSWRSRHGLYRARASSADWGSGITEVIEGAVLCAPTLLWRELWSLRALRDSLAVAFNMQLEAETYLDESLAKCARNEPWDDIWRTLSAIRLTRPLPSLALWNHLHIRACPHSAFASIEAAALDNLLSLKLDLIELTAAFLNGRDLAMQTAEDAWRQRRERFIRVLALFTHWQTHGNKPGNALNDAEQREAMTTLAELITQLRTWWLVLCRRDSAWPAKGPEAEGAPAAYRSTPSLLATLNARIEQLEAGDECTDERDKGWQEYPTEQWRRSPDEAYREFHDQYIDTGHLPARLLFVPNAQRSGLLLEIQGVQTQRLNPAQLGDGVLERRIYELLSQALASELYRWSLESVSEEQALVEDFRAMPRSYSHIPMAFHNLQDHQRTRVLALAFAGENLHHHGFADRIVPINVAENLAEALPDIVDNGEPPLPYIQPFMGHYFNLKRHIAESGSGGIPAGRAETLLLAQDPSRLNSLVSALAMGAVAECGDAPFKYWGLLSGGLLSGGLSSGGLSSGDKQIPLTEPGDLRISQAVMILAFPKTDSGEHSLDLTDCKRRWEELDPGQRKAYLNTFIEGFEQRCNSEDLTSGWPQLLIGQALIELERIGGEQQ